MDRRSAQVQPAGPDQRITGQRADTGGCPFPGREVPDGDGDFGATIGQHSYRLDTDAGGRTGHDRAFAGQVHQGRDVVSGRGEAERRSR